MVDDKPVICEVNSEALLRHGYGVNIMTDGDLAWQALQSGSYNLLNNRPEHARAFRRGTGPQGARRRGMDLPVVVILRPFGR